MKNRNLILIISLLLLTIPIAEIFMNLYGPLNSQAKEAVFLYPIFSLSMEKNTLQMVQDYLADYVEKSPNLLLVDENLVRSKLADEGINLDMLMKKTSSVISRELIRVSKTDKILRGYIHKVDEGWEFFGRVYDIRFDAPNDAVTMVFSDLDHLSRDLPQFAKALFSRKKGFSLSDLSYVPLMVFYLLVGLFYLWFFVSPQFFNSSNRARKFYLFCLYRIPEMLFIFAFVLFLFALIFSANANMDYVKKFIATGGNIALSQDSSAEVIKVMGRYLPLLLISGFMYVYFRVKFKRTSFGYHKSMNFFRIWGMPFVIISSLLVAFSFPSFVSIEGFGFLGFFALIPLFFVIDQNRYSWAVSYGLFFGILSTLISCFWLGTYNLFALQFTLFTFAVSYMLFMFPLVASYKWLKKTRLAFLCFPLGWVVFDYLRSLSFEALPWGFPGTSQYQFLPFIQSASLFGIWGVSFLVVLVNAALFVLIQNRKNKPLKSSAFPLLLTLGLVVANLAFGCLTMALRPQSAEKVVRAALIQGNMDPRKDMSEKVINTLISLTEKALKENPDIIIWPEGALEWYVRAELRNNPEFSKGAEIVHQFMDFQKKHRTWLLTGTYDLTLDDEIEKNEKTRKYNSSMFFSPEGEITQIYHKIHLVPFSEYFPYEKELPWVMKILEDFDEKFWNPGTEQIIFQHPDFSFFTPICFEDVFPGEIRLFVAKGADVIMNISNDFWSMTPVEAKQHGVISLFRAVENNRPMLRSTVSGLTCYISETGQIMAQLPYYSEDFLVVDVPIQKYSNFSIYTLWGDWFPFACMIILAGLMIYTAIMWFRRPKKNA
ncbi:MAG: apolipoprotein N-acyltransferase [Spirochaetales bacterium]|nr:apolipoprotein N-acyltransferase [Spirochaetales bacterium]